jgi:hypothetical protein
MSILEDAVKNLASALDALESRVGDRLGDLSQNAEAIDAARSQARAARLHAGAASTTLAQAIGDLKTLLRPQGETVKE